MFGSHVYYHENAVSEHSKPFERPNPATLTYKYPPGTLKFAHEEIGPPMGGNALSRLCVLPLIQAWRNSEVPFSGGIVISVYLRVPHLPIVVLRAVWGAL